MFIKMLDNFYIRYIVNFFFFMLQPKYWLQGRSTSLEWDKTLWEALRTSDFTPQVYSDGTCFTCKFNGSDKLLWVENFPYVFGRVYTGWSCGKKEKNEVIPLSITRWYFHKLLKVKLDAQKKVEDNSYWKSL